MVFSQSSQVAIHSNHAQQEFCFYIALACTDLCNNVSCSFFCLACTLLKFVTMFARRNSSNVTHDCRNQRGGYLPPPWSANVDFSGTPHPVLTHESVQFLAKGLPAWYPVQTIVEVLVGCSLQIIHNARIFASNISEITYQQP